MSKKFPVAALAASLILANGSSIASAAKISDDTSTTSTTIPVTRGNPRLTPAQQAALRAAQKAAQDEAIAKYKADLAKYLETRRSINTTFMNAMVDAQKALKLALNSATTNSERRLARIAFETAVRTATEIKNAALQALGAPPAKPVRP
jgi:hypothetical protein